MEKSKVYFTTMKTSFSENLPQKLERLIKTAGIGNIDFTDKYAAIKMHFGEPGNLAFLRPNYAAVVVKVIKELAKQHMTMIIVTHEMQFAKEVSDKIIFMEGGHIKMQGTPEEIFASENERVKEFIGKLNA